MDQASRLLLVAKSIAPLILGVKMRLLAPAYMDAFFADRVDLAGAVRQLDGVELLVLAGSGDAGLDLLDVGLGHDEAGEEPLPARPAEPDRRRLVPHDVLRPEDLDQHEHVERVDRRVHAPAED